MSSARAIATAALALSAVAAQADQGRISTTDEARNAFVTPVAAQPAARDSQPRVLPTTSDDARALAGLHRGNVAARFVGLGSTQANTRAVSTTDEARYRQHARRAALAPESAALAPGGR